MASTYLDRFDIAGNSMGGNTAWLYALAHPERLRRMVLIDAAGYATTGAPLVDASPNAVKAFFSGFTRLGVSLTLARC